MSMQPPLIELPPDLKAQYTNMARIAHTPAELVFDFAQILPGSRAGQVQARLIMSPVGAKLFYAALGENLARYEATYGPIQLPGDTSLATDLFRTIQPPEPPKA
ncbi:MAG TPA: DUF3467 domain-containing protein [Anaerolineaceae bacterium]|nr:DUF3467 domain-containing protein [Anaerolineaceae bacterium]HPN52068.1 DUF3467 domain-containing protein [Anaerolineaceae bacterium]